MSPKGNCLGRVNAIRLPLRRHCVNPKTFGRVNAVRIPLKKRCVNQNKFKRFSPYDLKIPTVHAAIGAATMRNRQTHFEQVPIEVAETVLRHAIALAGMLEKSPAPVSAPELPATAEFLKREESTPSKVKP